jgi:hypothetical protein
MIRYGLDAVLFDTANLYLDVMIVQASASEPLVNKDLEAEINAVSTKANPQNTIKEINAIMKACTNLGRKVAPLLTIKDLMSS